MCNLFSNLKEEREIWARGTEADLAPEPPRAAGVGPLALRMGGGEDFNFFEIGRLQLIFFFLSIDFRFRKKETSDLKQSEKNR